METLQASILIAIKLIRSSKKRADKLTVCKFIKEELQSITNEEITDTLKTLCALVVIENKSSNDKSYYFLMDNFNIADSQSHIPATMATPIIEKRASAEILSPTVNMKLTLSLLAMLRIMIAIPQRHWALLTVHTKTLNTKKLKKI